MAAPFLSICVWRAICLSLNLINLSNACNSLTSASSTGAKHRFDPHYMNTTEDLVSSFRYSYKILAKYLYCIRVSPFSTKKQKWWGCLMPFHASLLVCRCAIMYHFQSQMCSTSKVEVKASVDEAPRSMRANISFTESMSCRFKTLKMMLNRWSMSSCAWPTIRKERRTSRKYLSATRLAQYANMYLFLFSLPQLSACIHKTGGSDPLRLRTSPKTFANDVTTWLLSWT